MTIENDLDNIYDFLKYLGDTKRYSTIDLLLENIDPKRIDLDILLAILTVTSWYKGSLKNRNKFFKRASRRLDIIFHNDIIDKIGKKENK